MSVNINGQPVACIQRQARRSLDNRGPSRITMAIRRATRSSRWDRLNRVGMCATLARNGEKRFAAGEIVPRATNAPQYDISCGGQVPKRVGGEMTVLRPVNRRSIRRELSACSTVARTVLVSVK